MASCESFCWTSMVNATWRIQRGRILILKDQLLAELSLLCALGRPYDGLRPEGSRLICHAIDRKRQLTCLARLYRRPLGMAFMLCSCHALGVASNPSTCRAILQDRRLQTVEALLKPSFVDPSKAYDSSDVHKVRLIKVRPCELVSRGRYLPGRDGHQTDQSSIRASDATIGTTDWLALSLESTRCHREPPTCFTSRDHSYPSSIAFDVLVILLRRGIRCSPRKSNLTSLKNKKEFTTGVVTSLGALAGNRTRTRGLSSSRLWA
ncbi:hypothetical protein BDP81DRAFT_199571 [Colletotrichum phormii]|uniref:Uncharacterized protein n=1 Tax=Colletotrichum phormii TaxID=359342 RepID=A0AAI9ZW12_9PEZI|nr:uncharacterized protein BDP81DRAFT_199571 [Colletotrichum phormii]KAK1639259.1 hypothetical protein BDP81DRAFT_199571 [Colletotrichum phormii]